MNESTCTPVQPSMHGMAQGPRVPFFHNDCFCFRLYDISDALVEPMAARTCLGCELLDMVNLNGGHLFVIQLCAMHLPKDSSPTWKHGLAIRTIRCNSIGRYKHGIEPKSLN
ncbi:hypothetical protein FPOAC2_05488 [Fusarium poae]